MGGGGGGEQASSRRNARVSFKQSPHGAPGSSFRSTTGSSFRQTSRATSRGGGGSSFKSRGGGGGGGGGDDGEAGVLRNAQGVRLPHGEYHALHRRRLQVERQLLHDYDDPSPSAEPTKDKAGRELSSHSAFGRRYMRNEGGLMPGRMAANELGGKMAKTSYVRLRAPRPQDKIDLSWSRQFDSGDGVLPPPSFLCGTRVVAV